MAINPDMWIDKRVFVTGHTGFKGSWLALMLNRVGAKITGYSLEPPTTPAMFDVARVADILEKDHRGDIADNARMTKAMQESQAEIVFHLAAQPLVSEGYTDPIETYMANVMGTVHFLEAVRKTPEVRAAVIITTDKCYENFEWIHPYRENDRMGGADPYSASKGCAELVTASYQNSFFNEPDVKARIASVRAGNVIGGGDWAKNRLVVDCIKSFRKGESVVLRRPDAVRPWQHVLEPLTGYMMLAEKLLDNEKRDAFASGWNFGPDNEGEATVYQVASQVAKNWGEGAEIKILQDDKPFHESHLLRLDSTKAKTLLGWHPHWGQEEMIRETVEWYRQESEGSDMLAFTHAQIDSYIHKGEAV